MADLTNLSARPPSTNTAATSTSPAASVAKQTNTTVRKGAAPEEKSTVRVGALIVNRGSTSPRPGQPMCESPSSPSSPYVASTPVGSPRTLAAAALGPNVLTVHDACDLFDLHHALQHRLTEELGWSLHWYLDTESEIQSLALAKEVKEKATMAKAHGAAPLVEDEGSAASTPLHSDPNTPQSARRDAQGRQLPFIKQKSQFGVMSTRFECALCHELAAVRRSAFAFTPRSRLSRSPYEFRLASLRRWLRKRGTESVSDALLAACLSVTVQRYLAYLGVADCWTSLFVTAGLPVVPTGGGAPPSPSSPAAGAAPLRLPTTLSSPTRFDRVPLSFYVLPALSRWKPVKPARVETMLRGAAVHPFPLSLCAPANTTECASSLTFFTLQQQSYLPEKRRSSSRRNQMASLGECCACDVYLMAAPTVPTAGVVADESAADDGTTTAVASVWGYIAHDGSDTASAKRTPPPPTGELFYLASSLENYLRLGIVFGWVYGWQLCFSTAGPPPNSVPWLQWINASAYAAALAANADVAP